MLTFLNTFRVARPICSTAEKDAYCLLAIKWEATPMNYPTAYIQENTSSAPPASLKAGIRLTLYLLKFGHNSNRSSTEYHRL